MLLIGTLATPVVAQTIIEGTVRSANDDPIPLVHIQTVPQGPSDLFNRPQQHTAADDGSFAITLTEHGLYNMTFSGVFHRPVTIPLIITGQEVIRFDLKLHVRPYDDGRYFKNEEYLQWIRVYGDFNDYDFHSGISFSLDEDNLYADISSPADTLRLQARGLSQGVSALPGADWYERRRNGSFQSVFVRPSSGEPLTIRFNPKQPTPFHPPDGGRSIFTPAADSQELYVHSEEMFHLLYSAALFNPAMIGLTVVYCTADSECRSASALPFWFTSRYRGWATTAAEQVEQIEAIIRNEPVGPMALQAYLSAYVALVGSDHQAAEYRNRMQAQMGVDAPATEPIPVNTDLLRAFAEQVSPLHPLFHSRTGIVVQLLQLSEFSDYAIRFAEEAAKHHQNDLLVRETFLALIEHRAGEFESIEEMPYYRWIVQRYGENNLARRAILTFRDVNRR
ncbi:MAG: carboxypeptidase-like regulatory domain-containing protein [Balneolaceae bacterium]